MKRFCAFLVVVLTIVSMLAVTASPTLAEANWKSLYSEYLIQFYKTFRDKQVKLPVEYISFTDLDRDGTPEMLMVANNTVSGTNAAKLAVLTISGGAVKQTGNTLSLGKRALGFSLQLGAHNGVHAWLLTDTYRDANDFKVSAVRKLGAGSTELLFARRAKSGKTEYAVSKSGATKAVAKDVYSSEYKAFTKAVSKIGNASASVRVKSTSTSALKSAVKTACNKYNKYSKVKSVKLTVAGKRATRCTLTAGAVYQLGCVYSPASAVAQWTVASSDTAVVQVDSGKIKAVAPGTAVVRVKDVHGASASLKIKVVA